VSDLRSVIKPVVVVMMMHICRHYYLIYFCCICSTCNAPLHILSHIATAYLQAALTSEHFFGPSFATG